jgi:hypothetical protein
MFYQNDYITKTLKEREIRERIQEARIDQMLSEIQPHRSNQFADLACKAMHSLGHLLLRVGKRLDSVGTRDASLARQ